MQQILDLDSIRDCLDSAIPCCIATVAADGTPNVTLVSHAEYVDPQHLALSFQFFNKTRENILANPRALVHVTQSATGASYRIELAYLRTEEQGPLFERMKARLAGIASHTGMAGVFRLRGADVYRVLSIHVIDGSLALPQPPRRNLLAALRCASRAIAAAGSFDALLDDTLKVLGEAFDIEHAMLLMFDAPRERLYTVASRGYAQSGVGSEIALDEGVIGVAAAQRVPIRLSYASAEYAYGRAIRESAQQRGLGEWLRTEIPFPGLPDAECQLAVPLLCGARLVGVLYVESPQQRRYGYDDEDALATLAAQLAMAMHRWQDEELEAEPGGEPALAPASAGAPVLIRRYLEDDSVFIDEHYLIKGVAGAILCKLLRDHLRDGRCDFTNRELRLDPSLRLPDVADNLEARLALLKRRLAERCDFLQLHQTGRGRFRLELRRAIQFSEIARAASSTTA